MRQILDHVLAVVTPLGGYCTGDIFFTRKSPKGRACAQAFLRLTFRHAERTLKGAAGMDRKEKWLSRFNLQRTLLVASEAPLQSRSLRLYRHSGLGIPDCCGRHAHSPECKEEWYV